MRSGKANVLFTPSPSEDRIGMRYARPVDVVVTDAYALCLCGFSTSANGPDANESVNAIFNAHVCGGGHDDA